MMPTHKNKQNEKQEQSCVAKSNRRAEGKIKGVCVAEQKIYFTGDKGCCRHFRIEIMLRSQKVLLRTKKIKTQEEI